MSKVTNYFRFFDWKKLLLASFLSFGVMTGELRAQHKTTLGKVTLGKASDVISAFEDNNNARGSKAAEKVLNHKTSDGSKLVLKLNKSQKNGGKTRYMGYVNDSQKETFDLVFEKGQLSGHVFQYDKKKAFEYRSDASGLVSLSEVDINSLVCLDYAKAQAALAVTSQGKVATVKATSPASYAYQSLPGATGGTIFLDFDGHRAASSAWFGGKGFAVEGSNFSDEDIKYVFQSVSGDFAPFAVNVTTDSTVFASTPAGKRTRVIFTLDTWMSGAGGVAYVNSYGRINNEEPCWVFTDVLRMTRDASEAGTHEAGHTLGLDHDGTLINGEYTQYYGGQGNWAPIMGGSYGKVYSQWSKGEYQNANNTQDDLAIIAAYTGYKADDHGNTNATSSNVDWVASRFSKKGLISTSADIDVFKIVLTQTSTIDLNVDVNHYQTNLKFKADLYNASGTIVNSIISQNGQRASALVANLAAGTYYLQIDGVGQDDPYTTGFSDYASQGEYEVIGTVMTTSPGCTAAAWNSATAYSTNAVVSYAGNQYTAKWWTQGNQPDQNTGEGKPWQLNGPCSSNQNPVITLTKPVTGTVLVNRSDLILEANASDADGVIAYVEFYVNNTLVAKVPKAPYNYVHRDVSPANYTVKAVAVDNNGAAVTSSIIVVKVNNEPSVSFQSPAQNDLLTFNSNIQLISAPADTDGQIVKAEFFVDGVKVGEKTQAPWVVGFGPVAEAKDISGVLPIKVVVTDNDGATAENTVYTKVRVYGQNKKPYVVLGDSATTLENNPVTVTANAWDRDGSVTKVEFYFEGTKVGEDTDAPYTYTTVPLALGSYHVYAVATDDSQETTTSAVFKINATKRPSITITSPSPMSTHKIGSNLNVTVNASDEDGFIKKVVYFWDGIRIDSSSQAPFSKVLVVPGPNTADSSITLVAVAFDNSGAAQGTGCPIKLTKKSVGNTAPVVTITSPASSIRYLIGGSVTVSANVTDAEGDAISKVEIYSPQLGAGSTVTIVPPAAFTTTYSNLPSANPQIGGLTFVVKAYDSKGAVGTQDIFVYQDKVPTVSITSPSNSGVVNEGSVTIAATAFDDGNVTRVDFLNQIGAVIATDNSAPYEYVVNLAGGNYTYRAVAYDNAGQYSTTANVTFKVNKLPTASMTGPANNSVAQAGYTLLLTANASDLDGTVAKVEFYSNYDGKLGEDNTAPYEWTIPSTTKGNYQYFVKVTDNDGGENYSTSVYVLVNAAPTATFISPVANDKYAQTGAMQININAADVDGTVTKVEYFLGNMNTSSKIGEKTAAPFNLAVASVPLPTTGQNILPVIVKVTDNNGGITVADTYVQSVVNTAPTATITNPINNSSTSATSVTINVTATDAEVNTSVTKVEFLNNAGAVVSTKTTSPFTYALTGLAPGTYTYKARSYDALNAVSSVATVTFTITGTTCTATPWNSTTAYSTNAIVSYNGNRYKANYWSQGATPDTHSGAYQEWTNQGVCNSRQEQGLNLVNTALQVYPNPVAEKANVVFDLADSDNISIAVYNTVGEKIATVFEGQLEAGTHHYELTTQSLAAGVYIVRLAGSNGAQKVTIVKE